MRHFTRLILWVFIAAVYSVAPTYVHAQDASLRGLDVVNIARMTYWAGDEETTVETNPAVFQIEARRTTSEISFHRIVPSAPDAERVSIAPTGYSPTGSLEGPFELPASTAAPAQRGDLFGDNIPIISAQGFFAGEHIVVRVRDAGHNLNQNIREKLVVTISTEAISAKNASSKSGDFAPADVIVVQLTENGPDSGDFLGVIETSQDVSERYDDRLTIMGQNSIIAQYQDEFDATDVALAATPVNPHGRVFNSLTGTPIDGLSVTLIDASTGQPAHVRGGDGMSDYPSTISTGSKAKDSSGQTFDMITGGFVFPTVLPGRYQFRINGLVDRVFPSAMKDFNHIPNGVFSISEASYGETFVVGETGTIAIDIPVDPQLFIVATKTTPMQTAAIGDFIPYTVSLQNQGVDPIPAGLRDTLPTGFRLVAGSVRIDGVAIPDTEIRQTASTTEYDTVVIPPGGTREYSYVVEVAAGTRNGEAVNTAVAISGRGSVISNRAQASIFVQEDLLRSRAILVGKVARASCTSFDSPDPPEASDETRPSRGIAGVRLFLETGDYVVSDQRGMFHFEDVAPGTHVVQVDHASLPEGYQAMSCETGAGGESARLSKMVDVSGGVVWRTNFYLERLDAVTQDSASDTHEAPSDVATSSATAYLQFGEEWLNEQDAASAWAYPAIDASPGSNAINIGLKYATGLSAELWLNGQAVPAGNYSGRDLSSDGAVQLARWRSVDIQDGQNRFEARLSDAEGTIVRVLKRDIWFVTEATTAFIDADKSNLTADGRSTPTVAVRIQNDGGRSAHAGRVVGVSVDQPYQLKSVAGIEAAAAITESLADRGGVVVQDDGIAYVELNPTLTSGLVTVRVALDNNREEVLRAYLNPARRDWVVVGLAKVEAGAVADADGIGSIADAADPYTDGRLAVYAKGSVGDNWLVTLAVDTDKRRGETDGAFRTEIDPNASFNLFGDSSLQGSDAASRLPIFAKVETSGFQALLGDYNTDLVETELGRYSRQMSGFKVLHQGERFTFEGFAAETDQGFTKDEIPADGTSGPYQLSIAPLLVQSETVTIETRDRLRFDRLIDVRPLTRYVDYDIDYRTGELIFRQPVDATDALLNPRVIVVDYETQVGGERQITAGGRAGFNFDDGRYEFGITAIREGSRQADAILESDLLALDLTVQVSDQTVLRAEVGDSTSRDTEAWDKTAGSAFLVDLTHQSERLATSVYARQESTGFGLGQQSAATEDILRYGARLGYELSQSDDDETGVRSTRSIELESYAEENLTTGGERTVSAASLTQGSRTLTADAGLRLVREVLPDGDTRTSAQLVTGARRTFEDLGLTLIGRHEQPLGNENGSSQFPQRTLLGFDKTLTRKATLNARHEILDGDSASGHNTALGLTLTPWEGAQVTTQADQVITENSRRLGATFGVDQSLKVNDNWSLSAGLARRTLIDASDSFGNPVGGEPAGPLQTAPSAPLTGTENYTATYTGVGFQTAAMAGSARLEMRDAVDGRRYTATLGAARQLTTALTFAGTGRHEFTEAASGDNSSRSDVRFALAHRPDDPNGWIVFDRFDFSAETTPDQIESWRLVNNLAVNRALNDRSQAALFMGTKYSQTTLNGQTFEGWTHLLGGEVRHDITSTVDIGLSASVLHSEKSGTTEYAFGPSVGLRPDENVWVSVGWNIDGFVDEDFEAAEFSQKGPFVKLRVNFDQDTVKDILSRIGR